jgi:mannose-6-phosphate isomerase-like protein (cupin superfamily)
MTKAHVHEDSVSWQSSPDAPGVRWKPLLDHERGASGAFTFGLTELEEGAALPLASTAQAEVAFVLSGRVHARIGGSDVLLGEHDSLYVPPGTPRAFTAVGGAARIANTFACERLGQDITRTSVDPGAPLSPMPSRTWLLWKEMEDWAPVEAAKGLRVRFRRVMDRSRPVELIAGIGLIDPGTHYTRHFHDQPEIYYIMAGEAVVWVGDDEVSVHRGSTLDIGGRVVHGADSLGREPLAIYYVYGCERVGHGVNWTPVEDIYADVRRSEGGPR